MKVRRLYRTATIVAILTVFIAMFAACGQDRRDAETANDVAAEQTATADNLPEPTDAEAETAETAVETEVEVEAGVDSMAADAESAEDNEAGGDNTGAEDDGVAADIDDETSELSEDAAVANDEEPASDDSSVASAAEGSEDVVLVQEEPEAAEPDAVQEQTAAEGIGTDDESPAESDVDDEGDDGSDESATAGELVETDVVETDVVETGPATTEDAGDVKEASRANLEGAAAQIKAAQTHLDLLQSSLEAEDLAEAQSHAEHVINILDGESGRAYGDGNRDGMVQDPGDGVGVSLYLADANLELQASVQETIAAARQIFAADTVDEAATTVDGLVPMLQGLEEAVSAELSESAPSGIKNESTAAHADESMEGPSATDTVPGVDSALNAAKGQIELALSHYGFARDELSSGNLTGAQNHVEHVINILEGEDGVLYGDNNRDGQTQDPGDGVGIRGHLTRAQDDASQTEDEDTVIQPEMVAESLASVAVASETALALFAADSATDAQNAADELGTALEELESAISELTEMGDENTLAASGAGQSTDEDEIDDDELDDDELDDDVTDIDSSSATGAEESAADEDRLAGSDDAGGDAAGSSDEDAARDSDSEPSTADGSADEDATADVMADGSDNSEANAPLAIIAVTAANVRSMPSSQGDIVATLVQGDELAVLGQADDCAQLQVATIEDDEGWISSLLVNLQIDCDDIEAVSP